MPNRWNWILRCLSRDEDMKKTMIPVKDIAAYFLSMPRPNPRWSITHPKLQKLVFYAQALSLAQDGVSLIEDEFEAWEHGPICRSLYRGYIQYGLNAIPQINEPPNLDSSATDLLNKVWREFGHKSASELERMARRENPWIAAHKRGEAKSRTNEIVLRNEIAEFYRQVFNERGLL